ncbi:citrate transporter [Marinilactibacillus psychrotolerans]|uniref:Citrate transporter n=1 Tax=Marinilactibacillus psychrotolerans TaxID=191770 RepID=A0A5R9C7C2_9LACT|nr:citrate transporter [Marinilactibacillus psychrotolerans]
MFQALGILAVFVIFVILMMQRKIPTIIALPLMAILFGLIGGVPLMSSDPEQVTIVGSILGEGSMRMSTAIAGVIFGSFFGQLLSKVGVTKGIIRKAAETAGDKAILIALTFFAVGTIIISASGGLGMVILIGTIMVPIMLTTGVAPITASIVLLLSVGTGALFNVSNWAVYVDVLGLPVSEIAYYTWVSAVPLIVIGAIMIVVSIKKQGSVRKTWAMNNDFSNKNEKNVRTIALISPIIPVLLVFIFSMDVVAAIIIGIMITLILSTPKRPLQVVSGSFVEGIQEVAGAVALMIGIGMLLNAVMAPEVAAVLSPFIEMIIPSGMIGYILFFTILSPLAIYRGPLNVFGLGSGVAALLVSAGLSPLAAMIALRNLSSLQGVSDPTNSHNVWIADFTKVDVNIILRKTIGWMILVVFVSMVIGAFILY